MAQAHSHDEEAQPALVPMTDDELNKAGRRLAKLTGELAALAEAHREARAEMKLEREKLAERIQTLAGTIRTQGR